MASEIAIDDADDGAVDEERATAVQRVRKIHVLRDGLAAALLLPDQIKYRLVVEILRSSNVGYPDISWPEACPMLKS